MIDVFNKIIEGNLPNIETAQTVNTAVTGETERSQKYISMISEGKLGYMALLKNLNKIIVSNITEKDLQTVQTALVNERAIKGSRILPFRIAQAYEASKIIYGVDKFIIKRVLSSLEKAFKISVGNFQLVEPGARVALMLDDSASMGYDPKSPFGQGKVMTAALHSLVKPENAVVYLWSDRAVETEIGKPMRWVSETQARGGGTMLSLAVSALAESNTKVDYIFVFTDMQENIRGWKDDKTFYAILEEYRKEYNKDVKVVFWNLAGYDGGMPTPRNSSNLEISGVSDVCFKLIPKLLRDQDAVFKEIEEISL